MTTKTVSYTEARQNLSYIIKDAFFNENVYLVTQRDIPLATIQKAKLKMSSKQTGQKAKSTKKIDMALFGILKKDSRDSLEIEREWKEKAWNGI